MGIPQLADLHQAHYHLLCEFDFLHGKRRMLGEQRYGKPVLL
jgi:hypothetical protein